jgi:hypothetical protein
MDPDAAVVDVDKMDGASTFVDPVYDPVGAAPRAMASGEWSEQRLAHPAGVDGERALTELQYRRGHGLR